MTLVNAILLLVGALVLLVLICALAVWIDKKAAAREAKAQKEGEGYDERQREAQGKAANMSMITLLLYYGSLGMYWLCREEQWYSVDVGLLVYAGLLIGGLVYNIYSLMTDALLPMRNKMLGTGIVLFVCGLLILVIRIVTFSFREVPWVLYGSDDWMYLLYCVWAIAYGLTYIAAYFRDKRAEK